MNSPSDKPSTFDRIICIVSGILVISGIIYLIALLWNVLLPSLIAWLLAYTMQPFVKFFQHKLCFESRILSIMVVLVTLGLLITLLIIMVAPSIAAEADKTLELIRIHDPSEGHVPSIPYSWMEYLESNVDFARIVESLNKENLLKATKQIVLQLWPILSSTFSIFFSIAIVFVTLPHFILILSDYEKIANGWANSVSGRYRLFLQGLAENVEYSMGRYFQGQSLIVLSVGILLAIGFKIINFSLAVTLDLFTGVLNLIPYMQTIGITPVILLSLLRSVETDESFRLIFGLAISVLDIVQCIQDLYLTPRIMGKAIRLNPAIILLSLPIRGTTLGFIGLMITLPLAILCLSYYERSILYEYNKLDSRGLTHRPEREEINSDSVVEK